MGTILFTGFPGFLGSALLPRVLKRAEGDRVLVPWSTRLVGEMGREVRLHIGADREVKSVERLPSQDRDRGLGL